MGMHPPFPLGSATVTLLSFPDCCSIVHRILFISCSPLSAIGYNVNTVLSLEMTRNVFFLNSHSLPFPFTIRTLIPTSVRFTWDSQSYWRVAFPWSSLCICIRWLVKTVADYRFQLMFAPWSIFASAYVRMSVLFFQNCPSQTCISEIYCGMVRELVLSRFNCSVDA